MYYFFYDNREYIGVKVYREVNTLEQNQVGNSKKALYVVALNFIAINAILQIYQSLVPLIMQRDFKVAEWKIGIITGVVNVVVNVVVCVLLLVLNKIRRTIGMLIIGSSALVVTLALTPMSIQIGNVVFFVVLLYAGMISVSYIKVISNDFTLRVALPGKENSAMALTKITSVIGGIIVLLIMYVLNDNWLFWSMVLLTILTVGGIFCVRNQVCREKEINNTTNNKNDSSGLRGNSIKALIVILLCYTVYDAMTSTFSRYATVVWKMKDNEFALYQSVSMVTAFIAYIPIGKISNKNNQKKITLLGIGLMLGCLIILGLLPRFHFIAVVCLGLIGVAWAAISVNLIPIVVLGANEKEVSSLVGYYSIMCNIALVAAPVISGFALEYFSYSMMYPILSGILVTAILVLLIIKSEKVAGE